VPNLTVAAIEWLFLQGFLARGEERFTPSRETGGRNAALTGQQVESLPPQQT
jgi:hypothetical protein